MYGSDILWTFKWYLNELHHPQPLNICYLVAAIPYHLKDLVTVIVKYQFMLHQYFPQKRGSFSNFAEMVRSFERGLRHQDSNLVSDLCTNILWVETFMNSLDHTDNIMFR